MRSVMRSNPAQSCKVFQAARSVKPLKVTCQPVPVPVGDASLRWPFTFHCLTPLGFFGRPNCLINFGEECDAREQAGTPDRVLVRLAVQRRLLRVAISLTAGEHDLP